ncbi:unnamed protein product [Rotaria magnacalcarata]|uniref:Uncharacterized protein n=1 Tax=Rotaria magnacalcarata TaxID=392030 RepID=A0A8S2YPC4_9BILA|nr:unnamed protein product [Rotaria magnacalcarata]
MQSVPNNLNDIEKKLARHPNHKGLQAAYQSARNKRTPWVASILLVGLTGAGKSSTAKLELGQIRNLPRRNWNYDSARAKLESD